MKTKKILILILVIAMMFSILSAACSSSISTKDSSDANSASTSSTSKDADNDGREMIGNMYKTGLPIVKEKATYRMVAKPRAFNGDFEEMILLNRIEEMINVHIEWDCIPATQYDEKKNLMLASDDLPDAFFGPFTLSTEDIVTYGPEGVFIPIEDLLKEYAPRVMKIMEEHPMMRKVCTAPDGHIYSVPRAKQLGYNDAPDQMFMYKPWLDKLGLQVPDTLDEFYKVLTAFKTQDPNGNGQADEIPFTFRYNVQHQGHYSLFGSFGRADNTEHLVIENDKVVFTANQPEYKEAISYFHTYFKEGLFDKEAFTQDIKQYSAKGTTPDVIVGSFISWNDFDLAGAERANDYIIVPPMAGPSGKRTWNNTNSNGEQGIGFTITKVCKNPEIAIRWVDEFYDRKMSIEVQYGPIGYTLKENSNGTLDFLPTPEGMTFDEFNYKHSPVDAPSAVFVEVFEKTLAPSESQRKKIEYVNKYYRQYMTTINYPQGVMFTPEETKTIKTLKTDIMNYVNDCQAKWLMDGGIEQEWDTYVNKLKELKLDELLSVYQAAYDRFNK
jgi:putative aldouronate transport system substrate-binding protein